MAYNIILRISNICHLVVFDELFLIKSQRLNGTCASGVQLYKIKPM